MGTCPKCKQRIRRGPNMRKVFGTWHHKRCVEAKKNG